MALVNLPSFIRTIGNESHLDYSRQIVIESDWSESLTVLNRSYPQWVGLLQIGRSDEYTDENDMEENIGLGVEGWLSAFDGRANTANIPLHRPTIANMSGTGNPSISIGSPTVGSDGTLSHTAGSTSGVDIRPGMRVRVGAKVYSIRSLSGSSIVLDPQRPISSGSIVPATHIEARLENTEHPEQPRTYDFWGPWSIPWREA